MTDKQLIDTYNCINNLKEYLGTQLEAASKPTKEVIKDYKEAYRIMRLLKKERRKLLNK